MNRTYKPLSFFVAVFTVTWISWFIAAYLSYTNPNPDLYTIFLLSGLAILISTLFGQSINQLAWTVFLQNSIYLTAHLSLVYCGRCGICR